MCSTTVPATDSYPEVLVSRYQQLRRETSTFYVITQPHISIVNFYDYQPQDQLIVALEKNHPFLYQGIFLMSHCKIIVDVV